MAVPETIMGVGLAVCGIGLPAAVAMLKLLGGKKSISSARTILDRDIMTFGKCQDQRNDEREIMGGKIDLVQQKVDTVIEDVKETKGSIEKLSNGQTAILKAINGGK